jgi:fermentation-respiration switch protein FrsA (DUF1100 family)
MKFRLLVLIPLFALGGCTHLFFQPSRAMLGDPASAGIKYETIKFKSEDGTNLTGMFFPAAGVPLGTVVHFHGNADNMTAFFPYSAWLAGEGYNVFIFDYRGYGASEGKPTLDGLVADGRAALAHALKFPGAKPDRIIAFGQSLGGAIAVAAAAESRFPLAGLVLEGTFYSYKGVGSAVLTRHWVTWPLAWLPWVAVSGRHAPADAVSRLTCPKLFIHSQKDPVVPYAQGRRLFEAAPAPKEFWSVPSGHIEAFGAYRAIYASRLLGFLRTTLK